MMCCTSEIGDEALARYFSIVSPLLNERQRRLHAAAVVQLLGRRGQSRVAAASGMSRSTLIAGGKELARGVDSLEHVRRKGAGRKKKSESDDPTVGAWNASISDESHPALEAQLASSTRVTATTDGP
jgi:hypothetical protein